MRNWLKPVGIAAMAAGLYAIPANAAMPSDWDANADSSLTKEEFSSHFKTMDVFGKWDANKDGMISQAEFTTGMSLHGDDFKTRFSGTANADPYMTWNKDGKDGLTETEFYEGVYTGYDVNKDNAIQESEFGTLGTDTGTTGFWGKKS